MFFLGHRLAKKSGFSVRTRRCLQIVACDGYMGPCSPAQGQVAVDVLHGQEDGIHEMVAGYAEDSEEVKDGPSSRQDAVREEHQIAVVHKDCLKEVAD